MIRESSRGQRALGALVGVLLSIGASPANAYVRYTIKDTNIQFAWSQTCVPIIAYPNDMVSMIKDRSSEYCYIFTYKFYK